MNRREFITLLGGVAAAWPLAARAQQAKRMRRVGALMPYAANDPQVQERNAAFLQGLQQLGWTVGQNLQIDYPWSGGSEDDTRKYAAELVALAPDVILGPGSAKLPGYCAERRSPCQSCSRTSPIQVQEPGGSAVKREAEEDWGRNGDNAGQDAVCVWHGRTAHLADRRASSSRSMQKSEEHL